MSPTVRQRVSSCWAVTLLLSCGARTELPTDDGAVGLGGGGTAGEGAGAFGAGGAGAGGDGAGGLGGGGMGGGVGGIEQLALGAGHSCLRGFDGEVFCWGRNADGQLGVGTDEPSLVPVQAALPEPARFLAAGTRHTCAITVSDRVFCWGDNEAGQVEAGIAGASVLSPVELGFLGGGTPVSLALGETSTCLLRRDPGEVLCWGGSFEGVELVSSGGDGVTAGSFHQCVLAEGLVSCFGANAQAQCGTLTPTQIDPPGTALALPFSATGVRAGRGNHTCAFDAVSARCWGDNDNGQLGTGITNEKSEPVSPSAGPFEDMAPGFAHTCGLSSGQVLCWGQNGSGQLGRPGPSDPFPGFVGGLSGVVAIGTGTVHSCAYVSSTEIYCWGGNDFGQLGDGTDVASSEPVLVTLP
jgi:alpha-tubulin suppressor-like RCC1 family protein